eukprot:187352-Amphidinium_carterae.1
MTAAIFNMFNIFNPSGVLTPPALRLNILNMSVGGGPKTPEGLNILNMAAVMVNSLSKTD